MKNVLGDAPYPTLDPTHSTPPKHHQIRTPPLDFGKDLIGRVSESMSDLDGMSALLKYPSRLIREAMDFFPFPLLSVRLVGQGHIGDQRMRILAVRQDREEPHLVSPRNEQGGDAATCSHRGLRTIGRKQHLHRCFRLS